MKMALPVPPPGFHWQCIGYAIMPANMLAPQSDDMCCQAALKATGSAKCKMRTCHDLAERNVRLLRCNRITQARMAELTEDIATYCPTALMYQNWLLAQSDLSGSECEIRAKLKERDAR
jgi:hypothetical protein